MPTFKQRIKRLPILRQMYFNYMASKNVHMKMLKDEKINKGDVVLDFGANVGDISQIFADFGAEVHAYEPNPFAYAELEGRFKGKTNIHCHNEAIGKEEGMANLHFHMNHKEDEVLYSQAASLYAEKANLSKEDYTEVTVKNVESIINQFPHIRLIKIDIEGLEYDVLEKMIPLARKFDKVLCETHNTRYPELQPKHDKIVALIAQHNLQDKIDLDWV